MNLVIDLDICLFLPKCHTGQALSLFRFTAENSLLEHSLSHG